MNILVAIANYGTKNDAYLAATLREYRSMPCCVDVVVLTNVPKDLGPGVEVKVGLPARDPWSLPFTHKRIFADRISHYDLFIYSEDDMLVTWRNIQAFLRLTKALPPGEIAGFLRYELDAAGRRWYPDFVGPYHWLPMSVEQRGTLRIAEFSNAHAACYILTREQLRRAIRSGGFLVPPHKGRYDMLCSAATDPYTQCGMKKVICLSSIDDLLVHHQPNRYVGTYGIGEREFASQVAFMLSEDYDARARPELFVTKKGLDTISWDGMYYAPGRIDLLKLVPRHARTVLSIGCGHPSGEHRLAEQGRAVTVIPLDPIVGGLAADLGMTVASADLGQAFRELAGQRFDCIVVSEVLQHVNDPAALLAGAASLLAPQGDLCITVPNRRYIKFLLAHFPYPLLKRWTYERERLHSIDKRTLGSWMRAAGIRSVHYRYLVESERLKKLRPFAEVLDALLGSRLCACGKVAAIRPGAPFRLQEGGPT